MACEQTIHPRDRLAEDAVQTVDVRQFLGDKRVLRLVLDGEIYTLRLTKNDRLILTK